MNIYKWVCIAMGYVFIVSGVIKLINSDFRIIFANLGIPYPEMILFFVAITEIACGALLCSRIYMKLATMILMLIMITAILLTKLPFVAHGAFMHFLFESRLDILLLILLFALYRGYPYNRV